MTGDRLESTGDERKEGGARLPGFLTTAVAGGSGCLAFIAGAALAIVLFAPRMLSGYGARVLERDLSALVDGRVEVEGMRLRWGRPQTARRVAVYSLDDDLLIEGSLTLPSLIELAVDSGSRGAYALDVRRLVCRGTADGSSDLSRAFRLGGGESWLAALRERVAELAAAGGVEGPELRIDVRIADARLERPGLSDVTLSSVAFTLRRHRRGVEVRLASCAVDGGGLPGTARVSGSFVLDEEGVLASAELKADALPREILTTIGWTRPRADGTSALSPERRRDPFAHAGSGLQSAAVGLFDKGCAVDLAIGGAALVDRAEGVGAGERPVALRLDGPGGKLALAAEITGEGPTTSLVPRRTPGAFPLTFELERRSESLVPLFSALFEGAGVVAPLPEGASLSGASESFRIPLADLPRDLSAESLSDLLRAADLDLVLASTGGEEPRFGVEVLPSAPSPESTGESNSLVLEHHLTRVSLAGGLGGSIRSAWRTSGSAGNLTHVSLRLPGGELVPGEALAANVDLDVRDLPLDLFLPFVDLAGEFADVLPTRLERFVMRGLPLDSVLSHRIAAATPLDVELHTAPGEWFQGTFDRGRFRCPVARFSLILGDGAVRRLVFERNMPWLIDSKPLDPEGRVGVRLSRLEVELDGDPRGDRVRASADLVVESDPLLVRLDPKLLAALGRDPAQSDEWFVWRPGLLDLVIDRGAIEYRTIELPLADDEAAQMSGSRTSGGYVLTGNVERRFMPRLDLEFPGLEADVDEIAVTITAGGGRVNLSANVDAIRSFLERLGVSGR